MSQENLRLAITTSGERVAVLGVTDLEDTLEELDPKLERSLKVPSIEHRLVRRSVFGTAKEGESPYGALVEGAAGEDQRGPETQPAITIENVRQQ